MALKNQLDLNNLGNFRITYLLEPLTAATDAYLSAVPNRDITGTYNYKL